MSSPSSGTVEYAFLLTLRTGVLAKRGGALPDFIDWPKTNPPRRRRLFVIVVAVVACIVFGGRTALSYWVDLLWFRSLGYAEVYWKTLSLQWGIFTAFCSGYICHPVRDVF